MRAALPNVITARGAPANCGAAGTTFRFLTARASRIPGRHQLTGTAKLLARPQGALLEMLAQLGVRTSLNREGLIIEGEGWTPPKGDVLKIDRSQSSQFASSILLSAWDLPFDLAIDYAGNEALSEGYLTMTEALVEAAGLAIRRDGRRLTVARGSKVRTGSMTAESDLSSCFAIAALAALPGGSAVFERYPQPSLQPDSVFPEILRAMGARAELRGDALEISGAAELSGVDWNLRDCPDLFPVLATLCAFARGRSRLHGAPHLAHKESSRIDATAELLRGLGRTVEPQPDGMIINGRGLEAVDATAWDFDPRDDHRLAMAAALARRAGSGVRVTDRRVVDKSFPEFWAIAEGAE
jgi:3-phosphoshikimate 1-carboxyvinyltransferase